MIKIIIKKYNQGIRKLDKHTLEILKKSTASTVVKVGGMVIGVGVSIFLGRTLGAHGLGVINLSQRIADVILLISLFGMRQVIIKEVAIADEKNDLNYINSVMNSAYIFNGITSVSLAFVFILSLHWIILNIFKEPLLKWPLFIAIIAMIPQTFSRIFSSAIVGKRKIWQGVLVDQALSLFVVGIILFVFKILNYSITIINVAITYAIGRFVVLMTTGFYWNRLFPYRGKSKLMIRRLVSTSCPIFFYSISLQIMSSSTILFLGWLGDSKQVGLYSVALKIALLSNFMTQIAGAAISPKVAALFQQKRLKELEEMLQTISGFLFIFGLLFLLVFIAMGKSILSLWGGEFISVYPVLIILSIGQLVSLSSSASGFTLIMCGYEKLQSLLSIGVLMLNLLLNFFLIVNYGTMGAAFAAFFTMVLDNIIKVIFTKIKLGVLILPIPIKGS